MTNIKTVLAASSALALFAAAPASALSASAGSDTNVGVGSTVGVQVSGSEHANASNPSEGNSSDTNENVNGNAQANDDADLSIPLVVTHADVAGEAQPAVEVAVGSVETKADLSGYITDKLQADAGLSGVNTASDHVAVTHQEPARLLGIFPVSVDVTATTDASGNVTITKPWWDFLATSDDTNLQSNVSAGVDSVLGSNASAGAQLTAAQQAQLVSAIEAAMTAQAKMNASANATGSVRTK